MQEDGIAAAFALLNPEPQAPADTADGAAPDAPPAPSAEEQRLQGELESARAETARMREKIHRDALAGKVSDVNLALKVLDPERHLDADGNLRHDMLWNDFPALIPRGVTHPTAPNGGGGFQTGPGPTLERAVETGSLPLINFAFDQELNRR